MAGLWRDIFSQAKCQSSGMRQKDFDPSTTLFQKGEQEYISIKRKEEQYEADTRRHNSGKRISGSRRGSCNQIPEPEGHGSDLQPGPLHGGRNLYHQCSQGGPGALGSENRKGVSIRSGGGGQFRHRQRLHGKGRTGLLRGREQVRGRAAWHSGGLSVSGIYRRYRHADSRG